MDEEHGRQTRPTLPASRMRKICLRELLHTRGVVPTSGCGKHIGENERPAHLHPSDPNEKQTCNSAEGCKQRLRLRATLRLSRFPPVSCACVASCGGLIPHCNVRRLPATDLPG